TQWSVGEAWFANWPPHAGPDTPRSMDFGAPFTLAATDPVDHDDEQQSGDNAHHLAKGAKQVAEGLIHRRNDESDESENEEADPCRPPLLRPREPVAKVIPQFPHDLVRDDQVCERDEPAACPPRRRPAHALVAEGWQVAKHAVHPHWHRDGGADQS